MKRDFQEEYQNYIESDMPDLWSRIEPNLKDKKGKKRKTVYRMRVTVSVAAGLCVLVIGVGVMLMNSKSMKNAALADGMYEPEAACEEAESESAALTEEYTQDAGYAEDAEYEESAEGAGYEETADDIMEAAADEAPAEDSTEESGEEAVSWGEEPEAGTAGEKAVLNYNDDNEGKPLEISKATLIKISVASEAMQEKGYAYTYIFRLEDNSSLSVYLTKEQCDSLEEENISIERKAAYSLVVVPAESQGEKEDPSVGECFLQKIEKLP